MRLILLTCLLSVVSAGCVETALPVAGSAGFRSMTDAAAIDTDAKTGAAVSFTMNGIKFETSAGNGQATNAISSDKGKAVTSAGHDEAVAALKTDRIDANATAGHGQAVAALATDKITANVAAGHGQAVAALATGNVNANATAGNGQAVTSLTKGTTTAGASAGSGGAATSVSHVPCPNKTPPPPCTNPKKPS
jgi:hypothetical protein